MTEKTSQAAEQQAQSPITEQELVAKTNELLRSWDMVELDINAPTVQALYGLLGALRVVDFEITNVAKRFARAESKSAEERLQIYSTLLSKVCALFNKETK